MIYASEDRAMLDDKIKKFASMKRNLLVQESIIGRGIRPAQLTAALQWT